MQGPLRKDREPTATGRQGRNDTGMSPCLPAAVLALELYRQDKVSLGRAAGLCQMSVEQFMEFGARHNVPLYYGAGDLDEDRRTLERLGL
jgi:hypothetical protein